MPVYRKISKGFVNLLAIFVSDLLTNSGHTISITSNITVV